jgi:hypothetical protein
MVIHTLHIRIDDRSGKLDSNTPLIVISSPNVDFIPYLDISSNGVCRAQQNGRYGHYDFTLHPQVFYWPFCHNSVCPRKIEDRDHPLSTCWTTPTCDDFKTLEGSTFSYPRLGKLHEGRLAELCALVNYLSPKVVDFRGRHGRLQFPLLSGFWCAIGDLLVRLQHCSHTFRDLVLLWAEFGRLCLDAYAFMEWHNVYLPRLLDPDRSGPFPANTTLMGAFTADQTVVQKLGRAGIPVWYIRTQADVTGDVRICSVLKDSPPCLQYSTDWPEEDGGPCPILHVGPPNSLSQQVVKSFRHVDQDAVDIERCVRVESLKTDGVLTQPLPQPLPVCKAAHGSALVNGMWLHL